MLVIGGRYDGEEGALTVFYGFHLRWMQERALESHSRLECGRDILFTLALRVDRFVALR